MTVAAETRAREGRLTLGGIVAALCALAVVAAIVIPRLLGGAAAADDAATKARVRAMTARVEACHRLTGDYRWCTTGSPTRLRAGGVATTGPRGVRVVSISPRAYLVEATSLTGTTYQLARSPLGIVRSCWGQAGTGCSGAGG